ncbi:MULTISPECIES: hypothetical protein [Sulfurimonas]|uniref:Lipoprotein n=1 Tax=Sulfurimonas diazotrophicus TaxID=3131939 RepID=A0ABZ3H8L7_9BACT
MKFVAFALMFLLSVILTGCFTKPVPREKLVKQTRLAVIPLFEETLVSEYFGVTVFENTSFEYDISSWDLYDLVYKNVAKKIDLYSPMTVVDLHLSKGKILDMAKRKSIVAEKGYFINADMLMEKIQKTLLQKKIDYVLIIKGWMNPNFRVRQILRFKENDLFLLDGLNFGLYDTKTLEAVRITDNNQDPDAISGCVKYSEVASSPLWRDKNLPLSSGELGQVQTILRDFLTQLIPVMLTKMHLLQGSGYNELPQKYNYMGACYI